MASHELQTQKATDDFLLEQVTTFYLSLIPRATYDTPSTVDETRGVPSKLHATDDTKMR
jgi:hypothetical protein